jgi:hypothetical protein
MDSATVVTSNGTDAVEQAHAKALAPYTGAELSVITVGGAVLKRGESVHYVTPAALKEIKTVSLGYSGGSRGVSIPLPIKIGGAPIRYRVGQSR